nr:PREDICTED: beta-1,4-N-acetylgalactosaminyltransferase 3 [Latimeria chalumnae]|eukprot:XP_006004520.1 PREDICTED: beta-1,4-N-acetylgalactosaminyltransferase 3 [Latimeria chalumnae]
MTLWWFPLKMLKKHLGLVAVLGVLAVGFWTAYLEFVASAQVEWNHDHSDLEDTSQIHSRDGLPSMDRNFKFYQRRRVESADEDPMNQSGTKQGWYNISVWNPEFLGKANLHVFEDWCGSTIEQLRKNLHFPRFPHTRTVVKKLAVSPRWKNYGLRIFGYLHPYTNGEYQFAVASDDNAEFWLSSDKLPSNLQLLASVGKSGKEWTAPGEFGKYQSQVSKPVRLSSSNRYYFEVLHKQDDQGTDHVEVAWRLNQLGMKFTVIHSSYISLFANETALKMNELSHIPWTVACSGGAGSHASDSENPSAEMLRPDPRDSFFQVPLIAEARVLNVLPDCLYKPSYVLQGMPLERYQGLQFVHLSYIYPNDYTRLTHMESENKCFYNENSYYLERFGFSRFMKMDKPETSEPDRGLSRPVESFGDDGYEFEYREDQSEDLVPEAQAENDFNVELREEEADQAFSYGDDYDDYLQNRKRKLFSITRLTGVQKKKRVRKKASGMRLKVEPSLRNQTLTEVNVNAPDAPVPVASDRISLNESISKGQVHVLRRSGKKTLKIRRQDADMKPAAVGREKAFVDISHMEVATLSRGAQDAIVPKGQEPYNQMVEMQPNQTTPNLNVIKKAPSPTNSDLPHTSVLKSNRRSSRTSSKRKRVRSVKKEQGASTRAADRQPERMELSRRVTRQALSPTSSTRPRTSMLKSSRVGSKRKRVRANAVPLPVQAEPTTQTFQDVQAGGGDPAGEKNITRETNGQPSFNGPHKQWPGQDDLFVSTEQVDKEVFNRHRRKARQSSKDRSSNGFWSTRAGVDQGARVGEEEEEDLQEAYMFPFIYEEAVNWDQTFDADNLDFQALRMDWIDLQCNVSGSLLFREREAQGVVQAYMKHLNARNHGRYKLRQVVNLEKRVDRIRGNRYLLELELLEDGARSVRLSEYIFLLNPAPDQEEQDMRQRIWQSRQQRRRRILTVSQELLLCKPKGFAWKHNANVHFVIPVKNQARWVQKFISDMEQLYWETQDVNFNVIIIDYSSDDMDVEKALKRSTLRRFQYVKLQGNFERSAGLQTGINLISDQHSIVFLCDLHIHFPPNIIDTIRKHCVEGRMAFAPIVMRLNCGASPQDARGFWEINGFGLLGIYKSDLDLAGGMNTQEFRDRWGGEDWELLDR